MVYLSLIPQITRRGFLIRATITFMRHLLSLFLICIAEEELDTGESDAAKGRRTFGLVALRQICGKPWKHVAEVVFKCGAFEINVCIGRGRLVVIHRVIRTATHAGGCPSAGGTGQFAVEDVVLHPALVVG